MSYGISPAPSARRAADVEAVHRGENDARVRLALEDRAERRRDVRGRKRPRRDLVEERLEEVEVAPVDERDVGRRAPERARRLEAAEAAADDHDARPPAHENIILGVSGPEKSALDVAIAAAREAGEGARRALRAPRSGVRRGEGLERRRLDRGPRERGGHPPRRARGVPKSFPRRGDRPLGSRRTAPSWIVDPLDGTANFVRGFPHWAVSIARTRGGLLGDIEAGVVWDPVKKDLFSAERGAGAFRTAAGCA